MTSHKASKHLGNYFYHLICRRTSQTQLIFVVIALHLVTNLGNTESIHQNIFKSPRDSRFFIWKSLGKGGCVLALWGQVGITLLSSNTSDTHLSLAMPKKSTILSSPLPKLFQINLISLEIDTDLKNILMYDHITCGRVFSLNYDQIQRL